MKKLLGFCIVTVLNIHFALSQTHTVDSLLDLYQKESDRDQKAFLSDKILYQYTEHFDSAFYFYRKFLSDFEKENNAFGVATLNQRMGIVAMERSKYGESKKYFGTSIDQFVKLRNDSMQGVCYAFLGFVDYSLGDYEKAISNYLKAVQIYEKENKLSKLARPYNLMGLAFYSKPNPNYEKALFYYFKALEINNSLKLRANNGYILLRIGSTYRQLKDFSKAHDFLIDALKLGDSLKNIGVEMWSLEGLTQLYKDKKEYPNALLYSEKTLKIALRGGYDAPGIVIAYRNFSELNYLIHNYKKALLNVDSAIYYSLVNNIYQTLPEIYLLKSNIYEAEKNTEGAFSYFKLYTRLKDSLFNVQNNNNINNLEAVFSSKQKEKEIQFLSDQKASDKKIKQYLSTAVILSLILILVSAYALYKINLSKTLLKNKNKEVELQKSIIEEKQKSIIDSINYAKRIQSALMASESYIDRSLNNLNKEK